MIKNLNLFFRSYIGTAAAGSTCIVYSDHVVFTFLIMYMEMTVATLPLMKHADDKPCVPGYVFIPFLGFLLGMLTPLFFPKLGIEPKSFLPVFAVVLIYNVLLLIFGFLKLYKHAKKVKQEYELYYN